MEVEEPPEGSRAQGAAVLTVAGLGVGLAVFVYSRDAFVLLVWALGAAAVWWMARTPNRTPPPPHERGCEEEPQVSITQDPNHPNRWIVNNNTTGTP